MRQPGTEFNVDPHQSYGTVAIEYPEIPKDYEKTHQRWLDNTAKSRQHKFCANQCINFLQGNGLTPNEGQCMQTCFAKYQQAYSFFSQEKGLFCKNLEEVIAKGGNKYDHRNI